MRDAEIETTLEDIDIVVLKLSQALPAPDDALLEIADYVSGYEVRDPAVYRMARLCLMDALGCAIEALGSPALWCATKQHQ